MDDITAVASWDRWLTDADSNEPNRGEPEVNPHAQREEAARLGLTVEEYMLRVQEWERR